MFGGVHVVEHGQRFGIGQIEGAGAQTGRGRIGGGLHLGEECVVGEVLAFEQFPDSVDRIARPPFVEIGVGAVAGGVVGGGVRAHAVGQGLDEERPGSVTRMPSRAAGDGEHREYVVAVDLHGRHAEPGGALRERNGCLECVGALIAQ